MTGPFEYINEVSGFLNDVERFGELSDDQLSMPLHGIRCGPKLHSLHNY